MLRIGIQSLGSPYWHARNPVQSIAKLLLSLRGEAHCAVVVDMMMLGMMIVMVVVMMTMMMFNVQYSRSAAEEFASGVCCDPADTVIPGLSHHVENG